MIGMIKAEGSLGSLLVRVMVKFLDQHCRLLLEGELLIEEYFSTQIYLSILTYTKFREATKKEVSHFLHTVSIKGAKVLLIPSQPSKNPKHS